MRPRAPSAPSPGVPGVVAHMPDYRASLCAPLPPLAARHAAPRHAKVPMSPPKPATEPPLAEQGTGLDDRTTARARSTGTLCQPSSGGQAQQLRLEQQQQLHASSGSSFDLDHEDDASGQGLFETVRTRWRPSEAEKRVLYAELQKNAYPDVGTKDGLAHRMGVGRPQISKWFQHRREVLSKATGFVGYVQRARRTSEQRALLDKAFEKNPYPAMQTIAELVEKLKLSPKQVKLWFKHRRHAKMRTTPATSRPAPSSPEGAGPSSLPLTGISLLIHSSNFRRSSPPPSAEDQSPPPAPSNTIVRIDSAPTGRSSSPLSSHQLEHMERHDDPPSSFSHDGGVERSISGKNVPLSGISSHGSRAMSGVSAGQNMNASRLGIVPGHQALSSGKIVESSHCGSPSFPFSRQDLTWPRVCGFHTPLSQTAMPGQHPLSAVPLQPPPEPGGHGAPFQVSGLGHLPVDCISNLEPVQRSSLASVAICCGPWQPPHDVAERLGQYLGLTSDAIFSWFASEEASQIARMYVRRAQPVEYPLPGMAVPHLVHVPMFSQSLRLEHVPSFPSDLARTTIGAQGPGHPPRH
jgi:hypothetical protein